MESSEQYIPEIPPTPDVLTTRLELEYRGKLQHNILISIGKRAFDSDSAYEHGKKILDYISAIIDADTPEGEEIRELARAEKYEEAETKVIALLDLKKVELPQA
ncbi:MAG: hypothetical protein NUW02_01270 [Candidatus Campbellbacteria bacterium]|nr:hypothetical protein [Candidatus Campbellbacteria bacterium]